MRTLVLACLLAAGGCHSPAPAPAARPPRTEAPAGGLPADPTDDEVVALLQRAFDLARSGDHAALADLLVPQFPLQVKNGRGDTLLILAAYHGHRDTVALLIERGADVNQASDSGMTALMAAAFRDDVVTLSRLLEAGADPAATTPAGQTAADLARQFGNERSLRRLAAAS